MSTTPLGAERIAMLARCSSCGWGKRIEAIKFGRAVGMSGIPACPHHGAARVRTREIKGTTVAGAECGPRCWQAHTASCRCACGGEHHGTSL